MTLVKTRILTCTGILFLALVSLAFFDACRRPHHSNPLESTVDPGMNRDMDFSQAGEIVTPTLERNLIKVNNRLCAVSRTPMREESLGKYVGQVTYEGNNPKYQGKIFEFNYCCAMCQKSFPKVFKKDPDEILRFHGLI